MANNTNTFKPELTQPTVGGISVMEFTERNIFYFILVVGIIIITFYIFYIIKFMKKGQNREIQSAYNFKILRDESEPIVIDNKELECPLDFNKYSFTFFLEIHDYYSNRGYWKCVMLKGSDVGQLSNRKCNDVYNIDNIVTNELNTDCFTDTSSKCKELYDTCRSIGGNAERKCNKLKLDEGINIYQNTDLFERIDKICTAHELTGQTENEKNIGKKLFCCGVEKCGFFKDNQGNPIKMSSGQCIDYLDRYKTYCNKVYSTDKKVARSSEENRIRKSKNMNSDTIYYDDYDNICSVDNLLQNYPELLPNNIELNKEIELVNLSEKNNMDIGNPNVNDYSMEGLYKKEDIDNQSDKQFLTTENNLSDANVDVNKCNEKALNDGYNFFAMKKQNDIKTCKLVKLENEKSIYNTNKKSRRECGIEENAAKVREGSPNDDCYYVTKARKPEELVVIKCWEDIIRKYPYQNPGVWMHPYVNNIRIVFTTFTDTRSEKYSDHTNDIVHPHKENNTNYNIEEIHDISEHAGVSTGGPSASDCRPFDPTHFNAYREYFDIENIPIKDKFHIAIIANGKTIELYIDGTLRTSQVLFGNPRYNDGKLQINPGRLGNYKDNNTGSLKSEDILLGGTISNFRYFPHNINASNIDDVIRETSASQNIDSGYVSSKEHGHNIDVSHDHKYDQETEHDHKHGVDDAHIPQYYYTE